MQSVTYTTRESGPIQADVYVPDAGASGAALVWIHGGALILGHRGALHPAQRDEYLAAGYVVVAIDYRLAPEAKLPAIVEDVQDAFRWVRTQGAARFAIDPLRVAVAGHSAGGYLALLSGHRVQPRPRAIVSFYGYGDIAGPWYSQPDPWYSRLPAIDRATALAAVGGAVRTHTTEQENAGRSTFYLYCRQQGLWPREVVGHDPAVDPGAFVPLCPVRNVDLDYPPTLLLHGDQDTDVPYEQSVLMSAALHQRGIEHELLTQVGEGHVFDAEMEDPAVARQLAHVLAFLDRHV
jgi:acetyl esterase/lipase